MRILDKIRELHDESRRRSISELYSLPIKGLLNIYYKKKFLSLVATLVYHQGLVYTMLEI